MIRYSLRENRLTSKQGDYMATVRSIGTVDMVGVIERVTKRITTLPKEDAIAVITIYYD